MYIHDTIEHDFLVKVYRGKWNRRTRLIRQIAQKIGIFRREEREREGYVLFISRSSTISRDRFLLSPFKKKKQISELLKVLVPSTVGLSCLSSRNFPKTGRRERSFSVPPTCPQNDTRVWHDPREPSILRNDNQSLDGVAYRLIGSQDCLKLILFHEREGEDSPSLRKRFHFRVPLWWDDPSSRPDFLEKSTIVEISSFVATASLLWAKKRAKKRLISARSTWQIKLSARECSTCTNVVK